ncbi:MAG: hypothetical protein LBM09_00360 [Candidatus Nomurabacteria bacterium]|jgi:hypothetical protein|nr:hypothetical protein [Candidatus Nomurabacteria bacterium]
MTAQRYILEKLNELRDFAPTQFQGDIEQEIVRLVLSKKFRKYSANEILIQHIKDAVHESVSKNEPISLTFLHGAYKLWQLDEAPETDWAELFSLMYYTKWLKPICEIYKPGVWLDFYVDDTIIKRIDNLTQTEIDDYLKSYNKTMKFLSQYQPKNLRMTITTTSSKLGGEAKLDNLIDENLANTEMPILNDAQRNMVELNVRLKPNQSDDPMWREKVLRLHNSYMQIKRTGHYAYGEKNKILVFTQPLASGMFVAVGSTKNSIMKFWIGVGALRTKNDTLEMTILSQNQLENVDFDWQNVTISGLDGKNFQKVRVLK